MLTLLALGGMTCLVWGMTIRLAILDEKQVKLIGIPLEAREKSHPRRWSLRLRET